MQIGYGVLFPRMHNFAHRIVYSAVLKYFFGSQVVCTQNARKDLDEKIRQKTPFRLCASW